MRTYGKSIVSIIVVGVLALGTILSIGQPGAAQGQASLDALLNEVEILKIEFEKFERGNLDAGLRAQDNLKNIRQIAQDLKSYIQKELNSK